LERGRPASDHAVGYTFAASQAVLLDEVVDLCALCDAHVGVAVGPMLLLARPPARGHRSVAGRGQQRIFPPSPGGGGGMACL